MSAPQFARYAALGLSVHLALIGAAWAAEAATATAAKDPAAPATCLLRYRFAQGQTMRWDVTHRTLVRTTVAGTTQTAETYSTSVKVWEVKHVADDGSATFEQRVDDVDMRQNLSGCAEVRYNSRTDKEPPKAFGDVAQTIGIPLADITLDTRGKLIRREQKSEKAKASSSGELTIPLPEQPVAVGASWTQPNDIDLTDNNGRLVHIKSTQKFTLDDLRTGVARIRVETQILTPIHDPAIEAQLVQFATRGEVRFDVDAGRILDQQLDIDRSVIGFRGQGSQLHYVNRFTESFRTDAPALARLDAVTTVRN